MYIEYECAFHEPSYKKCTTRLFDNQAYVLQNNNFYTKVQVDKVKIKTLNCNKTTQSDSLAFMVWFDDI